MTTEEQAPMSAADLQNVVNEYAALDAHIKMVEATVKERTAALRKKRDGLKKLLEGATDYPFSMKADGEGCGTVSNKEYKSYKITDRDVFEEWLMSDQAYDLGLGFNVFSNTVSTDLLEAAAEAMGEIPPGLTYNNYVGIAHRKG